MLRKNLVLAAAAAVVAMVSTPTSAFASGSISFTDTRTTPVGNDKLTEAGGTSDDVWTVDLAMNPHDVETNGRLQADILESGIWSGTGPGPSNRTIDTIAEMRKYYLGHGVYYYQYQFHDTNTKTNTQVDIYPGPYSYQI